MTEGIREEPISVLQQGRLQGFDIPDAALSQNVLEFDDIDFTISGPGL